MQLWKLKPWPRNLNQTASGRPGAVQFQQNGTPLANASTNAMTITEGAIGITYHGDLTVDGGGQGALSGLFYGDNAQGTGGEWAVWNIPGSFNGADGVFLANEGSHTPLPPIPTPTVSSYSGTITGYMSGDVIEPGRPNWRVNLSTTDTTVSLGETVTVRGAHVFNGSTFINPSPMLEINETTRSTYQYSDWGEWGENNVVSIEAGTINNSYWVIGSATQYNDLPKSGSATYSGQLSGTTTTGDRINGDVSLMANFGNQGNIDGQFNMLKNNQTWLRITAPNMLITNQGGYAYFSSGGEAAGSDSAGIVVRDSSGAVVDGARGLIAGNFAGPNGEEAIGHWVVRGSDLYTNTPLPESGVGVFRARKQ